MQRRCDHDPRAPRLRLVIAVAAKLPLFLKDAMRRVERLYHHPDGFPELTGRAIAPRDVGRIRRRRSSRLEAIALVMLALLRRCDKRTLRVGDQREDGLCSGVSIVKLMEATGLTYARVSRALAELEEAGYIHSTQPVEKLTDDPDDDRHRGFPSVRVITPLMFRRLGISERKLKRAQRRGYEDWTRRRRAPASAVQLIGQRRELRRMIASQRNTQEARRRQTLPAAFYEHEVKLRALHPDWAYERIRAAALMLIRPPPRA